MGAYDWHRDYKVGEEYRLRDGTRIKVIRIHKNGSMTAEIFGCYDINGKPQIDQWDSQGWYNDYWSESEKDITGDPI
jgi:hypothetical protein